MVGCRVIRLSFFLGYDLIFYLFLEVVLVSIYFRVFYDRGGRVIIGFVYSFGV